MQKLLLFSIGLHALLLLPFMRPIWKHPVDPEVTVPLLLSAAVLSEPESLNHENFASPRLLSLDTPVDPKDLPYLQRWQQKIEQQGNQQYPRDQQGMGLKGSLQLLVSLRPNGEVAHIKLLRSSGNPQLDQAAFSIILKTAPFEPVPEQLLQGHQELAILKTWHFYSLTP